MKKIIINKHAWQTRIAIVDDNNKLLNIYFSAPTQEYLERSFFKGKVIKVLPGIQTAFIDIGKERAGFLHISEIDRDMAVARMADALQLDDESPRKIRREHVDISKVLRESDPILVQVSKEPVYEKGAKLTTCFTLPGRFLVLMPNIARIGVSKKIESNEERWRLKNLVRSHLPEGMGGLFERPQKIEQIERSLKILPICLKHGIISRRSIKRQHLPKEFMKISLFHCRLFEIILMMMFSRLLLMIRFCKKTFINLSKIVRLNTLIVLCCINRRRLFFSIMI